MGKGTSKLWIRIGVVIIAVGLIYLISTYFFHEDGAAKADGTIQIVVIDDRGQEAIRDEVPFYPGDTLLDVLKREYTVTCLAPSQKVDETCTQTYSLGHTKNVIILSIDGVTTDFRNRYLSLWRNGEYSSKGVMQVELKDGDVITFKVEDVN